MPLPLGDPQFWLVTLGAAVAVGYAARRIARATRAESERPCDKCPVPTARSDERPSMSQKREIDS